MSWGEDKRTNYLSSYLPIDFLCKRALNSLHMSSINDLSVQQLRQAANLKEKIVALEKELSQLFGSTAKPSAVKPAATKAPKKKGGMSAAGKARIVAAQKARWARIKAAKPAVKTAKPAKKKFTMSAAAKAKISAAAKARWAKIKGTKSSVKPAVKTVKLAAKPVKKARKKMSAAAKAKLSALAKARWAKAKATGKKKL
jgi:hypothetical protein